MERADLTAPFAQLLSREPQTPATTTAQIVVDASTEVSQDSGTPPTAATTLADDPAQHDADLLTGEPVQSSPRRRRPSLSVAAQFVEETGDRVQLAGSHGYVVDEPADGQVEHAEAEG